MKKGRMAGGFISMVAAALLAVLIYVLPEGDVVFVMGGNNVPWVPAYVLAGIGAALAATSVEGTARS